MSRSVSRYIVYTCTVLLYVLQAEEHEGAHLHVQVSEYIVYTCTVRHMSCKLRIVKEHIYMPRSVNTLCSTLVKYRYWRIVQTYFFLAKF
jgi:hypothetical protein